MIKTIAIAGLATLMLGFWIYGGDVAWGRHAHSNPDCELRRATAREMRGHQILELARMDAELQTDAAIAIDEALPRDDRDQAWARIEFTRGERERLAQHEPRAWGFNDDGCNRDEHGVSRF